MNNGHSTTISMSQIDRRPADASWRPCTRVTASFVWNKMPTNGDGPLAFFFLSRGRGETRRNFPKQRLAEVSLAPKSDPDEKKSFELQVLLRGWMKFTTTKTRWQISPDLDLCPVKSSSLIQAQKGQIKAKFVLPMKGSKISYLRYYFPGNFAAELHIFLKNYAAASNFPSCRISCDTGHEDSQCKQSGSYIQLSALWSIASGLVSGVFLFVLILLMFLSFFFFFFFATQGLKCCYRFFNLTLRKELRVAKGSLVG